MTPRVPISVLALACTAALAACGDSAHVASTASSPAAPKPAVPGGRILFSQVNGEHRDIYALGPDGTGLQQLTRSAGEALWPAGSPDGRQIAYEEDLSDRAVIAVADADGANKRVLTPKGFQGDPGWSPDGRWIAFGRDPAPGDNGVWIMRSDGTDLRRLTRNPWAGDECGCDGDPAFSPDGKLITFVRTRSESRGLGALFVMRRDGSHMRRLTPWRFDASSNHAWRPDGRAIMISDNAHPQAGESQNLQLLEPDGTPLRALTDYDDGATNALPGSWSPDGRHIAFKSNADGDFQIHVMDADGGNRRRITSDLKDPSGVVWIR